jgi:predicted NBD/HSP70 family sugar kinase
MDVTTPDAQDAVTTAGRALMLVHTGTRRRAELTRHLGLTRTGGSKVLVELERAGLIEVDDQPQPSGVRGRPSHLVRIAAGAPRTLAASITAREITVGVAALGGTVVSAVSEELSTAVTPEAAAQIVSRLAVTVIEPVRLPLCAAGVAIASAVDDDGRALAAHYLGWDTSVPIGQVIRDALDAAGLPLPVVVRNDADCAALAEHRHGAGREAGHLLYLTSAHCGIGGALVTNGQPYRGHRGTGSELSHLTVNPGGRPCHCGSRGCLNVEADATALLHPDARDVPRGHAGPELEAAARRVVASAAVDPRAREAVTRVADHLATALTGLVNILNPDLVILAGLPAELLRSDVVSLTDMVRAHTLLHVAPLTAAQIDDATLLGAAEYAFDPLLRDPIARLAARGCGAP